MNFERPTRNSARARRAYHATPEKLSAVLQEVIRDLPRWRLESRDGGELHAVRRTRILGFEDDVTLRIFGQANGSEVLFESASRIGKGDLGQNPRNLEELLEAVDQRLV